MKLVVFEDSTWRQFYPLSLNRPTFLLKCGGLSLFEKIKTLFPSLDYYLVIRENLEPLYQDQFPLLEWDKIEGLEDYLFVSGRVLWSQPWNIDLNQAGMINQELVAFRIKGQQLKGLSKKFFFEKGKINHYLHQLAFSFVELKGKVINYLFNLVFENPEEIEKDFDSLNGKVSFPTNQNALQQKGVIIIGKEKKVFVHSSARVYPGVYLNCENGPIWIDEEATIKPLTYIEGPCYIGKKNLVDSAKIRGGTSIFDGCKIAGEIENSIILEFSNKHHDGFLGHSYIGSFVNFGAMSTNSDLKNNYGEVILQQTGETIRTGSIKVGCFIGDHSKLGIGSLINTGSVFGLGSNLFFEGQMYPKEVSSFSWGGKKPFQTYEFEKFVKNCEKVLKRRNKCLTKQEIILYKSIFETETEK